MLKKIGIKSIASDKPEQIQNATRIILPGVGSFDYAMEKLNDLNLIDALNKKVLEDKVPTLGICLGMQLLAESSEEGRLKGFGWIPGEVKKLNTSEKLPHMGWNFVKPLEGSPLFNGYTRKPKYYFVHSYHFTCSNEYIIGTTEYGETFNSVVRKGNILGAQFHPEKSHKYGMRFLTNFIEAIK
jgi:glutamine amidotransferase